MTGDARLGVVLGTTDESFVTAYSTRAPFHLHGLVRVRTGASEWALGQVVETQATRPEALDDGEHPVRQKLQDLGFEPGDGTLYQARIRLLEERSTPVPVGADVVAPEFDDVRQYLLPQALDRAWPIGVVRGTRAVAETVPEALREKAPVLDPGAPAAAPAEGVPAMLDPYTQHEFPHIGIFGGSGSGKSVALRVLCENMMASRHPGLVLDPHQEMDFGQPFPGAGTWGRSYRGRYRIGVIGQDVSIDWSQLSTDMVRRLLASAFGASEWSANMDAAVGLLHKPGQDLATFRERIEVARSNYLPNVAPGQPTGDHRLDALRARHADLADLGRQVAPPETLEAIARRLQYLERMGLFGVGRDAAAWALEAFRARQLAVLRGPGRTLEFVGQYVLTSLYRQRRAYRDALDQGLPPAGPAVPPFWVVCDEAHNFAPRNPEVWAATRAILTEIAQEGRKYGVYLVLATQRPALLSETVTAQMSTKLILRTVRAQDLQTIRAETDLDQDAARRLPYLRSGDGYLSLAAQGRTLPVRIRVPYTTGRSTQPAWAELEQMATADPLAQHAQALIEQRGELAPTGMAAAAQWLSHQLGRKVSPDELEAVLEGLVAEGILDRHDTPFGPRYRPAGTGDDAPEASGPDGGETAEEPVELPF